MKRNGFSDLAEDILEALWIDTVEGDEVGCLMSSLGVTSETQEIKDLSAKAYIEIRDERLFLRKEGYAEARMTVRRHRLAERLTMDILGMTGKEGEELACEFEHLLRQGVDTKLCTMLNHPTKCPHGKPIPPGDCCLEARRAGETGIIPLTELKQGETAEIAYLAASDDKKMQKLMSMGVLPGTQMTLKQKFPSYIFKVGHSQFAVDDLLAREIHVRRPQK
jgi:DtxR family Mn-dependent transcriptional regulator